MTTEAKGRPTDDLAKEKHKPATRPTKPIKAVQNTPSHSELFASAIKSATGGSFSFEGRRDEILNTANSSETQALASQIIEASLARKDMSRTNALLVLARDGAIGSKTNPDVNKIGISPDRLKAVQDLISAVVRPVLIENKLGDHDLATALQGGTNDNQGKLRALLQDITAAALSIQDRAYGERQKFAEILGSAGSTTRPDLGMLDQAGNLTTTPSNARDQLTAIATDPSKLEPAIRAGAEMMVTSGAEKHVISAVLEKHLGSLYRPAERTLQGNHFNRINTSFPNGVITSGPRPSDSALAQMKDLSH